MAPNPIISQIIYFLWRHTSVLYLGQKYARIFVLGHYLFREAKNLSYELRATRNAQFLRTKYPSIFLCQIEAIVYIFPNFQNCACCKKDLKDDKHNSLHLGWKYARIFVLGHYLFLKAHSFPWATLSENCSPLRTDNVRGQMSLHIFAPNGGYCLFMFNGTKLYFLNFFPSLD